MIGRPKPKPAYLLVRVLPDPKPASGIILDVKTVRSLNPHIECIVVETGSPTQNWPMTEFVRGGQERVIMPRSAGVKLDWEGNEHRFIHVSEVIGTVNTKEYIELSPDKGEPAMP